jgi:hypothetical protein
MFLAAVITTPEEQFRALGDHVTCCSAPRVQLGRRVTRVARARLLSHEGVLHRLLIERAVDAGDTWSCRIGSSGHPRGRKRFGGGHPLPLLARATSGEQRPCRAADPRCLSKLTAADASRTVINQLGKLEFSAALPKWQGRAAHRTWTEFVSTHL